MKPLLIDLPDSLEGERVRVRPFGLDDVEPFYDAVNESREHLMPWMLWAQEYSSVSDARAYIMRCQGRWWLREELSAGVFERSSARLLGGLGLININWHLRSFEISGWLRKSAEGHGYMQEAVRLLTALAFETLAANRVQMSMDPRNVRSRRVPERIGYVYEGALRRCGPSETDQPTDRLIFSLIREDYQNLRSK